MIDANAKLNAILNATVDAMIIINHLGTVELFNAAAERMFGYDSDSVVGKNVKMLMPEPYQSEHDGYLHHYMQTKQKRIIGIGREVKAQKSNGDIFPIELSVGEVKDASHKQFVGIIRDISEQVQARSEAIINRERLAHVTRLTTMGEMAAGIAHEINQPLSAITSYAHASQNMLEACSKLDSKNQVRQGKIFDALQKISEQAIRAAEVVSRLRDFVKKRKVQREQVDLHWLIYETVKLAEVDTRLLDHGIALKLTDTSDVQVNVDSVQVQQVLFNLIRNAIDAMEDKLNEPVVIRTRWLDNDNIEVSVSDTGHGVSEANRSKLFNPFFSTKEAGMGIGLSISQSIIVAHGGELRHCHGVTEGSVFAFTLPANPV
jgi:two-component system sensor kinase FixL